MLILSSASIFSGIIVYGEKMKIKKINYAKELNVANIFLINYPKAKIEFADADQNRVSINIIKGRKRLYLLLPTSNKDQAIEIVCDRVGNERNEIKFQSSAEEEILAKIFSNECFK